MKRAVLKYTNIEKCIQNYVFATPLPPQRLSFGDGEKVYVASRIEDAKRLGVGKEYNYFFIFGEYLREDKKEANRLFANPSWKYFWRIKEIKRIKPFSLEELIAKTRRDKKSFYKDYRGEEMTHRVVVNILPEDEELFNSFTEIIDSQAGDTLEEDIFNKMVLMEEKELKSKKIEPEDNLSKIKKISENNLQKIKRKRESKSVVYTRDPELAARIKLLYNNKCQVCGETFIIPGSQDYYSESHHIIPLREGGGDTFNNIIIVCPTCHKKFDKKFYIMDTKKKEFKIFNEKKKDYINSNLSLDRHLLIN